MFYSRYWEDICSVWNSSVFFSFVSFYCISSQSRSHIFKLTMTSNQIPGQPCSCSPTVPSSTLGDLLFKLQCHFPHPKRSHSKDNQNLFQLFTGEEVEELTTFCAVIGIFLSEGSMSAHLKVKPLPSIWHTPSLPLYIHAKSLMRTFTTATSLRTEELLGEVMQACHPAIPVTETGDHKFKTSLSNLGPEQHRHCFKIKN